MGTYQNNNGDLTLLAGGTVYADSPIGSILPFGGVTAPLGWLFCRGQAVSRIVYADLFAVIGTSFGAGDGSTTFNLPNLQGKTLVGYNNSETEFNSIGKSGGEKTHTLSTTEIPSHNHGGATGGMSANNPHSHQTGISGSVAYGNLPSGSATAQVSFSQYVGVQSATTNIAHTHSITAQGGGGAHNNLQPYVTTNYIIRAEKIAMPVDFAEVVDNKISNNMIDSVTDGSMKAITSNAVNDFLTPTLVSNRTFASQSNYTINGLYTTVCGKMCTVNCFIKPITPSSSWVTCVNNMPRSMTKVQCGGDWAFIDTKAPATASATAWSPLFVAMSPNNTNLLFAYGTANLNYYFSFTYMLA